jgi:hypothetical protein
MQNPLPPVDRNLLQAKKIRWSNRLKNVDSPNAKPIPTHPPITASSRPSMSDA